jgi:hypothetical protein
MDAKSDIYFFKLFAAVARTRIQAWFMGKAAEGCRTPKRKASVEKLRTARSVLDCASPLALSNSRKTINFPPTRQNE